MDEEKQEAEVVAIAPTPVSKLDQWVLLHSFLWRNVPVVGGLLGVWSQRAAAKYGRLDGRRNWPRNEG